MVWRLPGHAHIPGQTRSADPQLENILADIDRHPDRLAHRCHYGCQLFEAGFYWEAHEAWEPVWHAARPNSAAALLIQAVIALANAALKIRMGQPGAARRLTRQARSLLAGCPPAAELEMLLPDRLRELADWLEGTGLDSLETANRKPGQEPGQELDQELGQELSQELSQELVQKPGQDKASPADSGPDPQKADRLAQLASGLSLRSQ